ncbi:MAG: hypothetical protein AAF401_19055 [Pseudomonadota bacterium]
MPTLPPLKDLAVVAAIVALTGILSGAAIVGLIVAAGVIHWIAVIGAVPALICAALFALHYLALRTCPPHLGAALGYGASYLWLCDLIGEPEAAFFFALPGAAAGYISALIGRRMLLAMGHPA